LSISDLGFVMFEGLNTEHVLCSGLGFRVGFYGLRSSLKVQGLRV